MNLYPQQTIQLKNEYDSLAILGYKLRNLGILRNVSVNDFGIDLEIDIVESSNVTGKIIKAQVKSSRSVKNGDGNVSVSNIKQSTLRYWMALSLRCPVIVFMVDLDTEEIYYSDPIETQAAALIDGTKAEKTIRLQHQLIIKNPQEDVIRGLLSLLKDDVTDQDKDNVKAMLQKANKSLQEAHQNFELKHAYIAHLAGSGTLADTKYMHLKCIENIPKIFALKNEYINFHMDRATGIFEPEFFRFFLKCTEKLLGYYPVADYCKKNSLNLTLVYREEYWKERSHSIIGVDNGEICYEGIRDHIPYFVALLLDYLSIRRKQILEHEFIYWFEMDPHYIEAIYVTDIGKSAEGYYFTPDIRQFGIFQFNAANTRRKNVADYEEKLRKKTLKQAAEAANTCADQNIAADESGYNDGES